MAMIVIFEGKFGVLEADTEGPLLRYTRSSLPFSSVQEIEDFMNGMAAALDRLGRSGRVILIDLRLVAGRNDPSFEATASRMRKRAYRGLTRTAVLVKTSLGAMHVQRVADEDSLKRFVTTDEAAALRYLLEGSP